MGQNEYQNRSLKHSEIAAYQRLRLRGLEMHPDAFGETADHFKSVSEEQLRNRLADSEKRGGCILVTCNAEGEFVATIGLAVSEGQKTAHRGIIWGMFVSPEVRGLGIAQMLLDECITRALATPKLDSLTLSVVTSNKAALKVYTSGGFEIYGTDRRALKVNGHFLDEYLMVKFLRVRDYSLPSPE